MRNCFFYYIYFLCKLQYNFHVIHFFVKITNHCLVLFVIFHIKHQSFPLRALSSSGYSQSASLRSSIPNNCCLLYTSIIFKRTAFSKKPDYIVTVVRFFYLAHLKQESYLIQLISIAISQNNAIKTFSRVRKTRKISDAVLHILMGWIALSIS